MHVHAGRAPVCVLPSARRCSPHTTDRSFPAGHRPHAWPLVQALPVATRRSAAARGRSLQGCALHSSHGIRMHPLTTPARCSSSSAGPAAGGAAQESAHTSPPAAPPPPPAAAAAASTRPSTAPARGARSSRGRPPPRLRRQWVAGGGTQDGVTSRRSRQPWVSQAAHEGSCISRRSPTTRMPHTRPSQPPRPIFCHHVSVTHTLGAGGGDAGSGLRYCPAPGTVASTIGAGGGPGVPVNTAQGRRAAEVRQGSATACAKLAAHRKR